MEGKPIHWRTGSKITHASVEILDNGKDIELVIDRIVYHEEAINVGGRSQAGMWEMYFKPNKYCDKPMVLNSVNRKRLSKLFPDVNGYITEIKNKPVRLTKELTRDVQDGGQTWGLRVSPIPAKMPEPKPEKKQLPLDKVDAMAKWAKEKGHKFKDIEKIYDMSIEVSEALKKAMKKEGCDD